MPSKCKECGSDALYDKRRGKRCAVCGWRWKPSTGHLDERPTRAANADCGEILSNETDAKRGAVRKRLCNDGSVCELSSKSIIQISDTHWMAVCHLHDE
jgi:hypothetical protein